MYSQTEICQMDDHRAFSDSLRSSDAQAFRPRIHFAKLLSGLNIVATPRWEGMGSIIDFNGTLEVLKCIVLCGRRHKEILYEYEFDSVQFLQEE